MPRFVIRTASLWFCTVSGWIVAIALFLGAPSVLNAQFTSVIEGRVTDATDAAVPNAHVPLNNPATGVKRLVMTSDVGYYRVASLSPGRFSVRSRRRASIPRYTTTSCSKTIRPRHSIFSSRSVRHQRK